MKLPGTLFLFLALGVPATAAVAGAQNPAPAPAPPGATNFETANSEAAKLVLPTVALEYTFTPADPAHYRVEIDATGSGIFTEDSDTPAQTFAISPATRDHIFCLVKNLNDLDGDWNYKKTRVAYTGDKVLTFKSQSASQS